ncbi:hypothetical protein V2J09_008477 [Rumex salicifolius]
MLIPLVVLRIKRVSPILLRSKRHCGEEEITRRYAMASVSLIQSAASSFHGQCIPISTKTTSSFLFSTARVSGGPVNVRAATGVVVDSVDAEKTYRLKTTYLEKIAPLLKEEFAYTNIHEIPKIEKVVVNCGIGEASQNEKGLENAIKELSLITGQRPVKTRAKKSIATFKLREGMPVGIAVTLRGNVMYSFLDRLINLALPRVRDFQGVNPNSFDGHGNYSIGFKEQTVFPEIRFDILGKPRGMDVCITTTAKTDKEAYKLLALMGMPFREGTGPSQVVRKKKLKSHHFEKKSRR